MSFEVGQVCTDSGKSIFVLSQKLGGAYGKLLPISYNDNASKSKDIKSIVKSIQETNTFAETASEKEIETRLIGQRLWFSAPVLIDFLEVFAPQLNLTEKVVLELGSGTGISGLFCAKYSHHVVLSDHDEWLMQLMAANVELNRERQTKDQDSKKDASTTLSLSSSSSSSSSSFSSSSSSSSLCFPLHLVGKVSQEFPGRASMSPILDLFITMLSMGIEGYRSLLSTREQLFSYFQKQLRDLAEKYDERLLLTPDNPISMGMTLSHFQTASGGKYTYFGSMLFSRCVSGTRTVWPGDGKVTKVGGTGLSFTSYGAHFTNYPVPYMTAACSIGMRKSDIDTFIERLEQSIIDFRKQAAKATRALSATNIVVNSSSSSSISSSTSIASSNHL
eukprot:TRINITY_DN57_c1_g1_i2.p1 TRINITY_DN57_c1_g1~~TRINITY_DN57_c1_g1_i2.p1  ORF type:complete len:390 (+),score=81.25 TRINITY_DN57_c1_g1_i2:79-1248(+)